MIGYRCMHNQDSGGQRNSSDPTFSIVIPDLHSPLIDQVVGALQQQTLRCWISEIIVVGQDRYNRVPATATFIETPQPISAAAARNLGARYATGQYLVFIDADCVAVPELLARLWARHQEGYAVVAGSVALEASRYWVLCDNLIVFASSLASARAGPRLYVPSLNLSLLRSAFDAVGGFDERLAEVGEDMDLSLRLRQHGYTLFFEPNATIEHRQQRTTARAVWQHLRSFGRAHVSLQRVHANAASTRLSAAWAPWSNAILAGSPLLALWDVLQMYRRTPVLLRYWRALPGLVWGRLAWYWGVVEGLMVTQGRPSA